MVDRASAADFDERTTVVGLLLEAIIPEMQHNVEKMDGLKSLFVSLKEISQSETDVVARLNKMLQDEKSAFAREEAANGISYEKKRLSQYKRAFIDKSIQEIKLNSEENAFDLLKNNFNARITKAREEALVIRKELDNLFDFIEKAFGDDNEMLLLVTDLTVNHASAKFITENGCDKYYQYNKKLMLQERNKNLLDEINEFNKMKERSNGEVAEI